jgi:hypothetical protein
MGRLLTALCVENETGGAAILAASPHQHGNRPRLLALADDEGLPPSLVHCLPDADAAACDGYGDEELRHYLRAQRMDAGLPPLEWGTPVACTCEACGPVLLWAGCPPVVKACPWCFRRKAGKPIARPVRKVQESAARGKS